MKRPRSLPSLSFPALVPGPITRAVEMGYLLAITLLIFYALGIWVFQATGPVRFLPFLALAVLVVDRLLIWKYGQPEPGSSQS